ncbi:MAG TPA: thiamine pyrophosphate-dependent enzyme [Spirochaetota bacterium]|nr:thiamine pyrophosphate-dependent enzyme [Spirochaetota bacterium]HPI88771.1 thiamine pyrophosphate-dependent enzyme [Spirochaetota bacterium]HPR47154.1 thiamine pyrophosphate-dependent enzyme [Spirochaetota bacterium]
MEKKVLLGNEAIARGAYEAGCHVAAAYPGTPSTEILETLARDYREIKSQWSPNEKVALEVAAGASVGGARALAAMKHVGLNVAADPLFTFSYTGVNGGFVIINADDPGAWSSQNEQDNRHLARAAKVPMIEPSDPAEAKEFTKLAFEISEAYDRPVIVRITTRIAHSQGIVELGERKNVPLRDVPRNPQKYVMIPAHARPRHRFIEEQHIKLKEYSNTSGLNRIEWGKRKRGIITDGVAYQYVKETCPEDSVLKIGMVWPMPDDIIREFAAGVEEVYVVEEIDPFIEDYVKSLGIKATGKEIIPLCGELTPEIVDSALNGKAFPSVLPDYTTEIPGRPPGLCKGCPHGFVFTVLKKLDLIVNGDIGCYTLAVLPPYSAMHTQGCMGASIGMHLGLEKAHGEEMARKSVAVIGDSTFVHSGITPLIDLVYNRGTGTVIILDNRSTAMTGHQDHPATGVTLMGEPTHELDLEMLARAVGVKRVVKVDPKDIDEFERVVREETAAREPSVIISLRKCILKK